MTFLTPKQVGQVRHKSDSGLLRERKRGEGPPWVRDSGRILYPEQAFWDYMASLTDGEEH
jgi:hypothetical protein